MESTQRIADVMVHGRKYALYKRGEGRAILALHGFSESHTTWDFLEKEGYAIYSMDLLGHGESDAPMELAPYSMESMSEDLRAIIEKYIPHLQAIIGYSMGGRLAHFTVAKYPQLCRALVLESAGIGIEDEKLRAERRIKDCQLADKIMENGTIWFAKFWAELPLFESQKALPKEKQQAIAERRKANRIHALHHTLLGSGQGVFPYMKEPFSTITMPILYLSGSKDSKYEKTAQALSLLNKGVLWHSIKGVGHNVHIEAPECFQKEVFSFLDRVL